MLKALHDGAVNHLKLSSHTSPTVGDILSVDNDGKKITQSTSFVCDYGQWPPAVVGIYENQTDQVFLPFITGKYRL